MARELREVWVITPPKMTGGIQWPIQLHREEQFARSIHEEHVKVGVASTLERVPLLTPEAAAVIDRALKLQDMADATGVDMDVDVFAASWGLFSRAVRDYRATRGADAQ